jgi:hypothetical protein
MLFLAGILVLVICAYSVAALGMLRTQVKLERVQRQMRAAEATYHGLFQVGTADPTVDGVAAPLGGLYVNTETGYLWLKAGLGNKEWGRLRLQSPLDRPRTEGDP